MRPHALPEDWQPTPGDINYAKSKGICEAQALEIAESFKAYYTQNAKGMKTKWKNWSGGNGAWGTWVRKERPWPAWQAAEAEPPPAWYEVGEDPEAKPQPKLKPKLRPMPFPPKRYTDQERQAILDKMRGDTVSSRPPPPVLGPARVPMPAEIRNRLISRHEALPPEGEE